MEIKMLFEDFVNKWLERHWQDAENGEKSRGYVNMLYAFKDRYWKSALEYEVTDLPIWDAFAYHDWLCKQNLSQGYRNLIMSTLKQAISDAVFEEGVQMPRWPKVNGVNYSRKKIKVLTAEQQDKVLEFIPQEHKAMAMAYFYHGLRPCEIRTAKVTDFDGGIPTLDVATAKGGIDRTILLEPKLAELLDETNCEYLFTDPNGKPYTRSVMYKVIRKALNAAGFSHVTPNQSGRHSAATNYLKRGASTRQVQYLMGHSKITTTERYLHPEVLDQECLRRKQ